MRAYAKLIVDYAIRVLCPGRKKSFALIQRAQISTTKKVVGLKASDYKTRCEVLRANSYARQLFTVWVVDARDKFPQTVVRALFLIKFKEILDAFHSPTGEKSMSSSENRVLAKDCRPWYQKWTARVLLKRIDKMIYGVRDRSMAATETPYRSHQKDAAKQWSLDWHLPLNDEKCVHMSFGGDSANSFVMHGERGPEDITRIDAKKDLGIWLSPNLSFSLHLEKSAQKIERVQRAATKMDAGLKSMD
ncbi:hypothetical protein CLF_101771 [Clonorchis sinensis]|uniref:Reverse transcriptase n=1 Tax=Clonorchis sinensis TaxID=79923 RepID=G7Y6J0_CLOSI|nr:hypothetical protein CLF_101771 [Clonorchis sinensis]